ncbi:MAG TPA: hypothetical protein VMS17_09445 [Gemmataceae bacterium]|nr:hypothetical protein [Gemmataceae bacterium]
MPPNHFACTHCGAYLKAAAGKDRVRCPRCKTVQTIPSAAFEPEPRRQPRPDQAGYAVAEEEPIDYLEEVEEPRPRPRRVDYDDEEDYRPSRRSRRRSRSASDAYLWLIAIGVSVASFFVGFGFALAICGLNGMPAEQNGNYPLKVGCLAAGILVMLVFAFMGVIGVKTRMFCDIRLGGWTKTGPHAVVFGFFFAIFGGSLSGFFAYGLLFALIRGH